MNGDLVQSTFARAGTAAAAVDDIGTFLYVLLGVVYVAVLAIMVWSAFSPAAKNAGRGWIVGGGVVLPLVAVAAIFLRAQPAANDMAVHPADDVRRIHVIGRQWWWEVRYLEGGDPGGIVLANELHLPVGERVHLLLETGDVIHSFWVPALAGKVDMVPGRTTGLTLQATRSGQFRGQCAEFCGLQHALMAIVVVAEPPDEFSRWLARQAQPATAPTDAERLQGQGLFFEKGCDDCHAIRGTGAQGGNRDHGPDLTHVGSRASLGAGILPNHRSTLGGWIAGSQDVKPGNAMPSDNVFTGTELRALTAYLASLQ